MKNENKNLKFKERRLELASKFMKMGRSLIDEGEETGFDNAHHAGATLILISGLILDDDDMEMFQYICGMFSAKKTLDAMTSSPLSSMMNGSDNMGMLDDLMDKLRGKMGENPDDSDDDSDK
jgi:hypothetical protein